MEDNYYLFGCSIVSVQNLIYIQKFIPSLIYLAVYNSSTLCNKHTASKYFVALIMKDLLSIFFKMKKQLFRIFLTKALCPSLQNFIMSIIKSKILMSKIVIFAIIE